MAIMRSRNVSPGCAVMRTTSQSREHARAARDGAAIAAALADDRRALARDGALVDRGDPFDDLAVDRDELAGGTRTTSPGRERDGSRIRRDSRRVGSASSCRGASVRSGSGA
jgi:hypothetical protein